MIGEFSQKETLNPDETMCEKELTAWKNLNLEQKKHVLYAILDTMPGPVELYEICQMLNIYDIRLIKPVLEELIKGGTAKTGSYYERTRQHERYV